MPTVTTTVTSAEASGVTTTVTTTEATPDTGAPSTSASKTIETMIGEWAAGTLPQSYPKYWSPSVKIKAGPGKVNGWGNHTSFDTFADWLEVLTAYNFNDLTSKFYPRPGGAVWEWSVSSLERKSDGKKCREFTAVNIFDLDENNMIVALDLIFDFSAVEEVFSDACGHVEGMIGDWATGSLKANASTWFADNATIDGGVTNAPGFGTYTMATFGDWMDELDTYDFNDIAWTFYPAPKGAIGEWTVSSLAKKSNGKSTGALLGVNYFTVSGGKITDVRISMTPAEQIQALHK